MAKFWHFNLVAKCWPHNFSSLKHAKNNEWQKNIKNMGGAGGGGDEDLECQADFAIYKINNEPQNYFFVFSFPVRMETMR